MQDRYLFRGKRAGNGEWVIWDAITGIPHDLYIQVKTICQCTGLKDKNGKLIWENDIVKHYNDDAHPENYCTGTVLWDENYAGFYRTSNEYGLSKPRISSDCIYEVVGNVFDNLELLDEEL